MYKTTFVKISAGADGRFFCCFPVGPHVLSHSTEEEIGPYDHVCESECVFERI